MCSIKSKNKTINVKAIRIFLIIAISIFFLICQTQAQGLKTVVIDAGHGGKDPGAVGPTGVKEKNVVLSVAKKTGNYIKQNFPDVKVIYTRETDVFLELYERSAIANKNDADLFISIHANAAASTEAYGTETFVLGLHKTEANLEVAKRENAVIELEDNFDKNYSFNPNSPEGHIMMTMAQNAYLDQSIFLASAIQKEFETKAKRYNRGVKQAGFYVLYKTTMPSILIELGFLSHTEEEKYLNSDEGQDYLSSAIYRAFKEYKLYVDNKWIENQKNKAEQSTTTTSTTTTNTTITSSTNTSKSPVTSIGEDGRTYKIQVYASKYKATQDSKVYQDFKQVSVEQASNGVYRYVVNTYSSYKDAAADLLPITQKGYKGAYIVAYKDGQRVQVYDVTSNN